MRIGPRDAHATSFEWLAQRIEHRALEFGQLVEKQNAEVRQTDFAGLHFQATARQRRHRSAMVRRPKRPGAHQSPVVQRARNARHHRHFKRFGSRQIGQYPRQT